MEKLLQGYFYKINHFGDNLKKMRHPFLFLGSNKGRYLFLQMTSCKYSDNGNTIESYYNKDIENDIIDGDINDGLEYHSQGNLNNLYKFKRYLSEVDFMNIEYMSESSDKIYGEILKRLLDKDFKCKWVNRVILETYNMFFS